MRIVEAPSEDRVIQKYDAGPVIAAHLEFLQREMLSNPQFKDQHSQLSNEVTKTRPKEPAVYF